MATTTKLADNATHNQVNGKCLGLRPPKAAKRSLQVGGDHDLDHDHPFNAAVPTPGIFETEQRPSGPVAPDFDVFAVPADENAEAGRENVLRQTFGDLALCRIAVGSQSLDLGWEDPRAIAFADENTYTSFNIHFNASADTPTFGGINPNSDTKLKGGAASWLRARPNDPNIQIGRRAFGAPYPDGKQLHLQKLSQSGLRASFHCTAQSPRLDLCSRFQQIIQLASQGHGDRHHKRWLHPPC